jgi:hypothetical protein
MARLTEGQKVFIITRLACFVEPAEIQSALRHPTKELQGELGLGAVGLDVPLSTLSHYNPTNSCAKLSAKLRELFGETRRRYLTDVSDIPVAHQAARLRYLQRLVDDPNVARNPGVLMGALKQAAEDVGGVFTNRREMTGADGAPLQVVGYQVVAPVVTDGTGDSHTGRAD